MQQKSWRALDMYTTSLISSKPLYTDWCRRYWTGSGLSCFPCGYGDDTAWNADCSFWQFIILSPFIEVRVVNLNAFLVLLLALVPASEEIDLVVRNGNTGCANPCAKRRTVAPLAIVRVVRFDSEDIHPLPTTSQLTATDDVGPVSHGGSAVPASRCAQTALILPGVSGGVIRAHSPGVGVVDVTSWYKDLAIDEGAGVTAAGHLHGSFHLPLVGGGHIALQRGLNTISVSPADGKQEAVEGVKAKVGALLDHVAQVNPSVEAGVISKECEEGRGGIYSYWLIPHKLIWQIRRHNWLLPAEVANGVFSLVPCIILVLTTCHIQEAIQDCHALIKALRWHFCQLIPHVICISVENVFAERFLC